jgi:GNAT superfamily N-acetyltransferase
MNLVPGDARWLQHVMMVAEEETEIVKTNGADTTSTRRVIGFCEVGRMSTPMYYAARRQPGNDSGRASTFDDDEHNIFSAPTILNLVISPHARRRGVATNLVSTAQHYVRRVWKEHQLCLFVDTNNDEALSLYQRLGFVPSQVQQSQDVLETAPSSSSLEDANKSNHHVALWQSWSETLSPTSSMTENPPNRYCHLRSHLF